MQVINGGQTCKTIQNTLASLTGAEDGLEKAFVLVRLYELPVMLLISFAASRMPRTARTP